MAETLIIPKPGTIFNENFAQGSDNNFYRKTNGTWVQIDMGSMPIESIDLTENPLCPVTEKGQSIRVIAPGKFGGSDGLDLELNDLIICLTTTTEELEWSEASEFFFAVQGNVTPEMIQQIMEQSIKNNGIVFFENETVLLMLDTQEMEVPEFDETGSVITVTRPIMLLRLYSKPDMTYINKGYFVSEHILSNDIRVSDNENPTSHVSFREMYDKLAVKPIEARYFLATEENEAEFAVNVPDGIGGIKRIKLVAKQQAEDGSWSTISLADVQAKSFMINEGEVGTSRFAYDATGVLRLYNEDNQPGTMMLNTIYFASQDEVDPIAQTMQLDFDTIEGEEIETIRTNNMMLNDVRSNIVHPKSIQKGFNMFDIPSDAGVVPFEVEFKELIILKQTVAGTNRNIKLMMLNKYAKNFGDESAVLFEIKNRTDDTAHLLEVLTDYSIINLTTGAHITDHSIAASGNETFMLVANLDGTKTIYPLN